MKKYKHIIIDKSNAGKDITMIPTIECITNEKLEHSSIDFVEITNIASGAFPNPMLYSANIPCD